MTNITVINCKGLFESQATPVSYVSESGTTLSFTANAKETKDPLFFLVDMSGVSATDVKLRFGDAQEVALTGGQLNIVPITTLGIKDRNGDISFKISGTSVIDASAKMSVQIISYTPVINH